MESCNDEFVVKLSMLNTIIQVILVPNIIEYSENNSEFDEFDGIIDGADAMALRLVDETTGYTEYKMIFDKEYLDAGVLAHESYHIVNMICQDKEIKLDPDNDEVQAYMIGYIVDKIYKKAKKYIK